MVCRARAVAAWAVASLPSRPARRARAPGSAASRVALGEQLAHAPALLRDQRELAIGARDLGLVAADLGLALADPVAEQRLLVGERARRLAKRSSSLASSRPPRARPSPAPAPRGSAPRPRRPAPPQPGLGRGERPALGEQRRVLGPAAGRVELDQRLARRHRVAVLDQDPADDAALEMLDRLAAAVGDDDRRGNRGPGERGGGGPAAEAGEEGRGGGAPARRGALREVRGSSRIVRNLLPSRRAADQGGSIASRGSAAGDPAVLEHEDPVGELQQVRAVGGDDGGRTGP